MAIPAEGFDTIDPALTAIAGTTTIVRLTCASLMGAPDKPFPAGSRIVPDLATGYPKITNGGKTYTYTVRKNARFSTGAPVTAQDVAHTINRVLNPTLRAYYAAYLSDIVGAKAVLAGRAKEAVGVRARGNRLTIRLTKPLGDFNARVAVSVCVLPAAVGDDPEGVKPPIATAAPYTITETPRRPRGDREESLLPRLPAASCGPGRRRHLARLRDRNRSCRSGRARLRLVPTGDYADRAAELRRKYGINRKRFLRRAGELPPVLRAQHGEPALQEQRPPTARRELRRRSEGAAPRAGTARRLSHRPVPAAGTPRLPGCARLPARGDPT